MSPNLTPQSETSEVYETSEVFGELIYLERVSRNRTSFPFERFREIVPHSRNIEKPVRFGV